MKTSFYFVLWIALYAIIFTTGGHWMQNNAFFVALIGSFAIGYLVNRATENQIIYSRRRESINLAEMVLQGDVKRYLGILRRRYIFNIFSTLYLAVATMAVFVLGNDWIIGLLFGFFTYGSARGMSDAYRRYAIAKKRGTIVDPDDTDTLQAMEQYRERRAVLTLEQATPPPTIKDKLLRVANILCAILSLMFGLIVIALIVWEFIISRGSLIYAVMMLLYGGLAALYGLSDLISSIKGYEPNVP